MTDKPEKVEPDTSWTEQEKWVWAKLLDGEVADFNADPSFGGELDPKNDEIWTEANENAKNRILTPKFLQTILTEEIYYKSLTHHGVRIIGAWFKKSVDLSNITIINQLWLDACRFEFELILAYIKSNNFISLESSVIKDQANMQGLKINSDFNINKLVVCSTFSMNNAKIFGNLTVENSEISRELFMSNIKVEGLLSLAKAKLLSSLSLSHSNIQGQINMNGVKCHGKLNMQCLRVGGSLLMRNRGAFGEVDLTSATIVVSLEMDCSTFRGEVNLSGIDVFRISMTNKAEFLDKVTIVLASIGSQLVMSASIFLDTVHIDGLKVKDLFMNQFAEFFGDVILVGADINGQLSMDKSFFSNGIKIESVNVDGNLFVRGILTEKPISILFTNIRGNLAISASTLKTFDLTGSQISGEFCLGSQNQIPPVWEEKSKLILRNVKAGALQDLSDSWPNEIELDGYTYSRLSGFAAGEQESDRWFDRGTKWMTEWLSKHEPYSPQPYEQLAKVLTESGHKDTANEILYAKKVREYNGKENGLGKAWLWLLDNFIGYGYYPKRVFIWIVIFTAIGALSLQFSGQGQANNIPFGIAYSFDMLLPIIELNEMHYSEAVKITGGVKYYFYFHKLIGWFLATVLIAGLSGITKK